MCYPMISHNTIYSNLKKGLGMKTKDIYLNELFQYYPQLTTCRKSIEDSYALMKKTFLSDGTILICGNGGSCADSDHIVGELIKGFALSRKIPSYIREALVEIAGKKGETIAERLQKAIPVINLCSNISLLTAVANDTDPNMIFAQQLMAYSNQKNLLIGISPIGKAENIINAFYVARALGIKTIALTGRPGNELAQISDVALVVQENEVYRIQELHLPIYHTLCLMLEAELMPD